MKKAQQQAQIFNPTEQELYYRRKRLRREWWVENWWHFIVWPIVAVTAIMLIICIVGAISLAGIKMNEDEIVKIIDKHSPEKERVDRLWYDRAKVADNLNTLELDIMRIDGHLAQQRTELAALRAKLQYIEQSRPPELPGWKLFTNRVWITNGTWTPADTRRQ